MSLVNYSKSELDTIGMTEDSEDEMTRTMRVHILKMVELFEEEGHSGFSASYVISILSKLLKFEPLKPLTGEDSEWNLITESDMLYQNKRCPYVFKDRDGAYDIQGKVFVDEKGGQFTNYESRVWITFPYTPKIEFVNVVRGD